MTRRGSATIAAVVAVLVLAVGCSGSTDDAGSASTTTPPGSTGTTEPPGPPTIVASTPLVGALVRSVGGDEVELEVLVEPGADPTAASVDDPEAALDGADLLVLVDDETFETGLADLIPAAEDGSVDVLELAPQLGPIPAGGSQLDPGSTGSDGGTAPQVWLDTDRWTQAARLVGDELVALGVDPAVVQGNIAAFDDAASAADEGLQASFAIVPEDRRVAGTDLGGLGYLGDRYGIELVFSSDPALLANAVVAGQLTTVFTSPDGVLTLAPGVQAVAPQAMVVELDLDATALDAVPPTAEAATQAWFSLVGTTGTAIVAALTA